MTTKIVAVHVPCSTCAGTGHVPLVPSLAETLAALSDGPRTPRELSGLLDVPGTAMNNRLEKLRALGLVRRERTVRGFVYERTRRRLPVASLRSTSVDTRRRRSTT